MASIEVDPDQVTAAGDALGRLAGNAEEVGRALRLGAGGATRPPLTAAALEAMVADWQAGSEYLGGELASLGQAAQAAGFLYRLTDDSVIPASPP